MFLALLYLSVLILSSLTEMKVPLPIEPCFRDSIAFMAWEFSTRIHFSVSPRAVSTAFSYPSGTEMKSEKVPRTPCPLF